MNVRPIPIVAILMFVVGCTGTPADTGPKVKDLVGKWKLVRADGKAPAENMVTSQEVDLAADGTWSSVTELAGFTMKGGGKWSIAHGIIDFDNGKVTGKSKITLGKDRLILDPDFQLRTNEKNSRPLVTEYER